MMWHPNFFHTLTPPQLFPHVHPPQATHTHTCTHNHTKPKTSF